MTSVENMQLYHVVFNLCFDLRKDHNMFLKSQVFDLETGAINKTLGVFIYIDSQKF